VGVTLATILPFLIASIVVLLIGRNLKQRTKRFKAYVRVIGKRTYCQVRELAASVDKPEELVVKDLQKMIENRSFPYAHLDEMHTCLMLNQETYEQYLQTQKSYQERALQEQQDRQAVQSIFSSEGIDNPELVKAIEEGNRYIEKIRKANDAIPGEEISNKLFRLESLIRKIFEILKQKPTQLPKLRKFMNYYMPTTLKLVQTYQELDAQPVEGENIRKSKKEIEETLDTINMAYEKLLDSFFEDAAMDITTDRSVLEAMFAQEGLTKNHFENNKEGE
jgi:5-bromo-4-chloroindolyl phosphate hydrolysis protein